jgi:catalase-peroxidase
VNLLDMNTRWQVGHHRRAGGSGRSTGELRWTGTRVDLVFGSNSQLRAAIAEVYAQP